MTERGIRVLCRFRPQNKIEDERGGSCCVTFTSPSSCRVKEHDFVFDRVFPGEATQREIYEEIKPAVADLLEGYNATIFAYGQTSSGSARILLGTHTHTDTNSLGGGRQKPTRCKGQALMIQNSRA